MYSLINVPAAVEVVARSSRTVALGISGTGPINHEARLAAGFVVERGSWLDEE
jgi:hypothetical protein